MDQMGELRRMEKMEQIDWVVELEKKVLEKKRRFKMTPWWMKQQTGPLKVVDFICDQCQRKIILQYQVEKNLLDRELQQLYCECGKLYTVGAEVVNHWIKPL
jgi:hypothetical protein